jgi:hypothetical protein
MARKEEEIDWEQYEREARKRTAWGHYTSQMGHIRAVDEEQKFQKELRDASSEAERKKIKENKKKKDENTSKYIIIS